MSVEPDKKIDLGETSSGHDQWLELYIRDSTVKAVKKNSMPVHDKSTYNYVVGDDGLSFSSGSKSCSGAGKSRSVSPSDKIDSIIRGEVVLS